MALDVNGKSVELDGNGNLVDPNAWDEDVAKALAAADDTMGELTQEHWDVSTITATSRWNARSTKTWARSGARRSAAKTSTTCSPAHPANRATASPACPTLRAKAVTESPGSARVPDGNVAKRQPTGCLFLCGTGQQNARRVCQTDGMPLRLKHTHLCHAA